MTELTLHLLVSPVRKAGTYRCKTAQADVCDCLRIWRRVPLAGSRVPLSHLSIGLLPPAGFASILAIFRKPTRSPSWRIGQC